MHPEPKILYKLFQLISKLTQLTTYATYSYCFKAIIKYEVGIAPLTCFSPELDSWLGDCQKMLSEAGKKKDDRVIPEASKADKIQSMYFNTTSVQEANANVAPHKTMYAL